MYIVVKCYVCYKDPWTVPHVRAPLLGAYVGNTTLESAPPLRLPLPPLADDAFAHSRRVPLQSLFSRSR